MCPISLDPYIFSVRSVINMNGVDERNGGDRQTDRKLSAARLHDTDRLEQRASGKTQAQNNSNKKSQKRRKWIVLEGRGNVTTWEHF